MIDNKHLVLVLLQEYIGKTCIQLTLDFNMQ